MDNFNALWSKLSKIERKTKDVDYGVTGKRLYFEWDGNTEGREYCTLDGAPAFYKVSDATVKYNDIFGREAVSHFVDAEVGDTGEQHWTADFLIASDSNVIDHSMMFACINNPGDVSVADFGVTFRFPSKGVYFALFEGSHMQSIEFPEVVKPIDPKFLPDNTVGEEVWGDVVQAAIITAVSSGKDTKTFNWTAEELASVQEQLLDADKVRFALGDVFAECPITMKSVTETTGGQVKQIGFSSIVSINGTLFDLRGLVNFDADPATITAVADAVT